MRKGAEDIKGFRETDIQKVTALRVSVLGHSLFNDQMFMQDSAGGKKLTKIPVPWNTQTRREETEQAK